MSNLNGSGSLGGNLSEGNPTTPPPSGTAIWGQIGGSLEDQADLAAELLALSNAIAQKALASDLQDHIDATGNVHSVSAAQVPVNPRGNIAATDVESALYELDSEKLGSGSSGLENDLVKFDANGNAAPATSADVIDAIGFTPIDSADADLLITTAIDDLKDGVPTPGDTLQKLYNLILGSFTEVIVPNIAARDAYNVLHTPTNVFVEDDGDTRWALYKATTTGTNASYVKLSDPDLLNAVMSAAQIKTAYESNTDTNAFTNALLSKLNGIAAGATANSSDATLLNRANHTGTQAASTITEDSTHRFTTDAEKSTWNGKQDALAFTPENAANKSSSVVTDQTSTTKYPTVKSVFDWAASAIAWVASYGSSIVSHLSNTSNPHSVTKAQIGLSDVDNTSDLSKPVSTATQSALDLKQDLLSYTPENVENKNVENGYAGLDGSGKIPSALLPSFVDDVIEETNLASLPATGDSGKIYVTTSDNKTYRWSGSAYVEISSSPGSTDSVTEGTINKYFLESRVLATVISGLSAATNAVITAADSVLSALGKLQKQITDLSSTVSTNGSTLSSHTSNTSNPHSVTKAQIGLSDVDNTSDINKPVSTAQQTALNLKVDTADVIGNGYAASKGYYHSF